MSVLDRKLRRDLYAAKLRLASIIVIIMIGVAVFLMYLTLYFNLEMSRAKSYSQCRMADFWVSIERMPLAEVQRIQAVPGISEVRPRISQNVTVDIESERRPLAGTLISMPENPKPVINNIVIKRGSYFTGLRREEVILGHGFAMARGLNPGDTIHAIINDRRQELLIVGTAVSSEYAFPLAPGSMIPDKAGFAIMYVRRDFAEEILNLEGAANEIVGILAPEARDRSEQVLREVERRLAAVGLATTLPRDRQVSHLQVSTAINTYRVMSIIAPLIFLGAAALILDIIMQRMAAQQRTVIGTLKALGHSNLNLIVHFLKFGVIVGVVGGLLGAGLGYFLAGLLLRLLGDFFEFTTLVNRPYPWLILAAITLSVTFAMTGTLRGLVQVVRLQPAESMRPKPPATVHKSFLERSQRLWKQLGFRWQMVIRDLLRQRLRVATGLLCSTVGTMLIFLALTVQHSMNEMVAFTFGKMMVSDIDLAFQGELEYEAFLETKRLPGVDYAEPILRLYGSFSSGRTTRDGAVTGLIPNARLTIPRDGRMRPVKLPDVGLVITTQMADIFKLRVGDTVRFTPKRGQPETLALPVARIVEGYTGPAAYASFEYVNRIAHEEASLNAVQTQINPTQLDELYAALKQLPRLQGFSSLLDQESQLQELMEIQRVALRVMILFAGMLFCASVLTASLVSLAERRQEIATFRVLGYRQAEVASIFIRETFMVNLVGMLMGLPLGYALARWMIEALATESQALPMRFEWSTAVWTVGLGLLFTTLANLPVVRAIGKMDWLEALNVKE